jgi:RNA polymerase sigma factor for flagellar operon FliA
VPDTPIEELWRRWSETRDALARERLVLHYSPLVKFVVGRLRSRLPAHVEAADLTSDGLIGLLDAMERFDGSRGLQFQTFAMPRIRGAVLDGLRAADWLPRQTRERMRAVDEAEEALAQRLARRPTTEELAAELAMDPEEVRRAREDRTKAAAVSWEESPDETAASLVDDRTDGDELPAALAESIRQLPERDQVVLALYYWERLTLAEIGQVLGVTESRVSQLHSRAARRLQDVLAQKTSD